ncbi:MULTISPECIES: MarR family transcriptional regulator [unclassified Streptomyces]|uniref:MarR family winged helix-turn-helix transcriptional regulator n=1 Tax=unclassified Streptomyces TaxID=2593676 RepID=UPI002016D178|nr:MULTISPECIES: MarR family transcriptional regulator [unclassified Streptomyces]
MRAETAGRRGGQQVPSMELAQLAARLCAALDATTNSRVAQHGLTRADYDVLAALRGAGGELRLKPTELAARCRLSSGGTSNVLRRMSESGYVVREADLADGRSAWAQLTEEGLLITSRIQDGVAAVQERRLALLPPGAVDALSALLAQAAEVLEAPE